MSAEQAADLAIRLTRQFGSVSDARLPELYVQAQDGLAQCYRVDECKTWADKAEAIRSYARQAKNTDLEKTAARIKDRAWQRLGQLIDALPKEEGGRPKTGTSAGTSLSPQKQAASEAGLSKRQLVQAVNIARVPAHEATRMIERERPATLPELAARGRQAAPPPKTSHLKGHSPEDFKIATRAMGAVKSMATDIVRCPPHVVVKTLTSRERAQMLKEVQVIGRWIADITKKLRRA